MTKEEAIKILREQHDKALFSVRTALETIFPELRESEDERTREEIISALKWANHRGVYDKHIAYLEKQKINTEGDFGRGYDCGYEACLNSHGAEWFEKQKEQEPWKVGANAYFTPEQKPVEPSDEDERIRKDIVAAVEMREDLTQGRKSEIYAYLERQKEQKPVELNGNETSIAVKNPEAYKIGFADGEAYAREQKEQKEWKPSEEQMKALLNAEGFLRAGLQHDSAKTIAELYEQIKRLM